MKPSIPKGTRDFGPQETARRNYIFSTIRRVMELHGYRPIETPSLENLSTLMGKYGEEGDRLLFKVLNSGDYLAKLPQETLDAPLNQAEAASLAPKICEKGLRYDLTVPFARYVVMHRQEITLPFKRYQIQPVWRADRPQKGRYREFTQCDADVIGSTSLFNENDLIQMADEVFKALGIRVIIKLNNRKVLTGLAEIIGAPEHLLDITTAIDKIDKIGLEAVEAELQERGLTQEAIEQLRPVLELKGTNFEKLDQLFEVFKNCPIGQSGVAELEELWAYCQLLGTDAVVEIDPSLARGLNYYTGTIIEIKARDAEIGSISGGGRYDNLTGIFGMPDVSGVGISFGADRIYDVIDTLKLWPDQAAGHTDVVFLNMGDKESNVALELIKKLRQRGTSCELYPDPAKMKKQMAWADAQKARYVAIIGEEEMNNNTVTLKNMADGSQQSLTHDQLLNLQL